MPRVLYCLHHRRKVRNKSMQNTEYIKLLGKILVFNQGSSLCLNFIPTYERPTFLWFWDTFYSHSHIGLNNPVKLKSRYLHFFVLNPQTNPRIIGIQGLKSFYTLCKRFLEIKYEAISSDPPILQSWDNLVPDIVFDFENELSESAVCVFPEQLKGRRITFFDELHMPINFFEIPEFIELLPELKTCKSTYKSFMKVLSKMK